MKRLIEFKFQEDAYLLEEEGITIFTIKVTDLKFSSLDFYNGVYKDKLPQVELINKLSDDPHKKGEYIYSWLADIIAQVNMEFPETDLKNEIFDESTPDKLIRLFEYAACAGDGFFIDGNIPYIEIPDPTGKADFAVNISGDSMEPTIVDKSTIYIQSVEELQHKDVGLFVVNGDVMCKRYIKCGRGYKLVPDNNNGSHKTFGKEDIITYKLLGKVIL